MLEYDRRYMTETYEETLKQHYLPSTNEMVCLSCTESSVDIPCVSDAIFRMNVFLIDNVLALSLKHRLLSKYRCRCLRVCIRKNAMKRFICQITILYLNLY